MVGGGESQPSLSALWEEFGKDPLFADLDLLQDLRILRRAVRFVLECYPQFEGARRLKGIRNAFIAFGGHRKGEPAEYEGCRDSRRGAR